MEQTHLEILLEEIRSKFDLVLEGHEALHAKIDAYRNESNEKHDLTAFQLGVLNTKIGGVSAALHAKIDAVAADFAAHRTNTEAHVKYRIRE